MTEWPARNRAEGFVWNLKVFVHRRRWLSAATIVATDLGFRCRPEADELIAAKRIFRLVGHGYPSRSLFGVLTEYRLRR